MLVFDRVGNERGILGDDCVLVKGASYDTIGGMYNFGVHSRFFLVDISTNYNGYQGYRTGRGNHCGRRTDRFLRMKALPLGGFFVAKR